MDTPHEGPRSTRERVELIASVMIGFAAVLTAIATYQGNRLDGEVRDQNTEALAQTSFANDVYNDANAQRAIERDWFFGWLLEYQNGRVSADYLANAMPPDVWTLIEEWDAAGDDGILNPFSPEAMESYESYAALPSVDLLLRGNDHMAQAQCAIFLGRVADNLGEWVDLSTVFLAITLVTAGIAGMLRSRTAQRIVLGVAILCLLSGASLLAAGTDVETTRAEVAVQVFGETPQDAELCVPPSTEVGP